MLTTLLLSYGLLAVNSLPLNTYEGSSKRIVDDSNFTGYQGDSVRLIDSDPNCFGFFFDVYVTHLAGHLYIAFIPLPFVSSNSCLPYLYDSRQFEVANETVSLLRHITLDDWSELKYSSFFVGSGRYIFDLRFALSTVDPPVTGQYDMVTNNCAYQLIRVLNLLNFMVDAPLMEFCLEQLLGVPTVMELLLSSPSLGLLFPNMNQTEILNETNETLLQSLIMYTVDTVQSSAGERITNNNNSILFSILLFCFLHTIA